MNKQTLKDKFFSLLQDLKNDSYSKKMGFIILK